MPPSSTITLCAEFADEHPLLECCRQLRAQGRQRLTLFSPIDLPEAYRLLGLPPSRVPAAMLVCGVVGGVLAYALQWWTTARAYPLAVGGMPLHSAPAFIPITFESVILAACLAGFLLVLGASGLPRLWHPAFEIPGFERASRDRFFLAVACPQEDLDDLTRQLTAAGALQVTRQGSLA